MKVLHIGLLSYYTDGMLYQDNLLTKYNALDGHDTIFISNNAYYKNGAIVETDEEDVTLSNGVRLIRLRYDNLGLKLLTNKIQKVNKLLPLVKKIKPDIILWHGCCGYELTNIAKYVKDNFDTILYIDSHEDFGNTAKTILSKFFYKYVHGYFINKVKPYVKKFLATSYERKLFIKSLYNIDDNLIEIFPLGGEIIPKEKRTLARKKLIEKYHLNDDSIILIHSGKLDKKKYTKELLRAFINSNDKRLVMLIFGYIPDNQINILKPMIESDNRIHFLGWKVNEEITDILLGGDLYCQPGTCSSTLETALCAGTPCMVYSYPSYKILFNERVLYTDRTIKNLLSIINDISCGKIDLTQYKIKSQEVAKEKLDYRILSRRYLS